MDAPALAAALHALDEMVSYWPLLPTDLHAAVRALLADEQPGTAARGRLLTALTRRQRRWGELPPDSFTADLLCRILDADSHPFLVRAADAGPAAVAPALRRLMVDDLRRWQEIAAAVEARLPTAAAAAAATGEAAVTPAVTEPQDPFTPPAVPRPAAARQAWLKAVAAGPDWGAHADSLGALVHTHGLGCEQGCLAYRFEADDGDVRLRAIRDLAAFDLDWLEGNRERIEVVEANTRNLLDGFRAHNTLIWGPRGCGKSSLIRGLLTRYADRGLRGIEIPVASYPHLGRLYALVRRRRESFIGVLDNVALERTDLATRALSSALDGGLEELPPNLVFYATSNFKDLVDRGGERPQGPPATQSDDAPEALRHTADTSSRIRHGFDPQGFQRLDERRALDDRFALKVFIDMPTKSEYDRLVVAYARRVGIDVEAEQLLADFQVWCMRHNHDLVGGRTARDYVLARYPEHARQAGAQR